MLLVGHLIQDFQEFDLKMFLLIRECYRVYECHFQKLIKNICKLDFL